MSLTTSNPPQYKIELVCLRSMVQNLWSWTVTPMGDKHPIARGTSHFRLLAKLSAKRAMRTFNREHQYSEVL